jgi:predicted O-methyltransferase YrrM
MPADLETWRKSKEKYVTTLFYDNLRTLALALRHPIGATRYLYIFIREATVNKTSKICKFLNASPATVTKLFQELDKSDLNATIKKRIADQVGLPLGGMTTTGRGPVLYVICRLLKPKIVVETGVASGVSSTYILHALHKNAEGKLYSIDFPNPGDKLPTGWLVPDNLRDRWRLIFGKSSDKLPTLLNEVTQVDIFLHDSDHSYENMMYEFEIAWPYIRKGGLLLSDDTHMNTSFFDFSTEVGRKALRFYLLSLIRK